MRVKKRNGNIQEFDNNKIKRCILMAFSATKPDDVPDATPIVKNVLDTLIAEGHDDPVSVEIIQDVIERVLMYSGYGEVARGYIIYRHERDAARDKRLRPDSRALSDYIHAAKYAGYLEDQGRREVFSETVARSEQMHRDRFPDYSNKITEAFSYVYSGHVLPSMRSMQFGGKAVEANHARLYNCSFTLIDRPRVFQEIFFLLLSGCGVGYSLQWQHIDKLPAFETVDETLVYHHTIDDSIEGWADAVGALVKGHLEGYYVEFNYSKIRPYNSILKTSGGRAPGHLPLKKCLEQVRKLLNHAAGRKIRPIEAHDIICFIALAVLSGGIRRSSLICLFSHTDTEMMYAKAPGNFNPSGVNYQRVMANNSAVLKRDESYKEVFDRVNRISAEGYGEPGFFFTNNFDYGCNPCVVGSSYLATNKGYEKVIDLYNRGVTNQTLQQNGGLLPATKIVKTGENVPVFSVLLKDGHELQATENHRFPTFEGTKKLKDLEPGDKIFTQKSSGYFGSEGSYEEGLLIGLYTGDGTDDQFLGLWGDDCRWETYIKDIVNSIGNTNYQWYDCGNGRRFGGETLKQFIPNDSKEKVPDTVFKGSFETVKGYLEGLVFTDGSVIGTKDKGYSLRVSQSNLKLLQGVQILLDNCGIKSQIRKVRDAGYGIQGYWCKASYELRCNPFEFVDKIGLFGPKFEKIETLERPKEYDTRKYWSEVSNIEFIGKDDVYCLKQPKTERVIFNGILTLNCAEIGLYPVDDGKTGFSFCNLCEVNVAKCKSENDFYNACIAASLIGTLQATYTSFPYLGPVTEKIAKRDALLGVGLTGMADNPSIAFDTYVLQQGANLVKDVNAEWVRKLNINPAARCTTVKPSGTASLELGCVGSGIHPHHARRYFRRVTANPMEPVAQEFARVNPHMVEYKSNGDWALVFPIQTNDDAVTIKDEDAISFLRRVSLVYNSWVVPGSRSKDLTHNVSATVTLRDGESVKAMDYVWKNRHSFAALSTAPHILDKKYPHAPREEVTKDDEDRWNYLIKNYQPIDWTKFRENQDNTSRRLEVACAGGTCEI